MTHPQTPLGDRTDTDRYAGSWPLRSRFEDHTPTDEDLADAVAAGVVLDPDWLREIGAVPDYCAAMDEAENVRVMR